MEITKDSIINDVVSGHNELIPIFLKYGLHCIGCHVSLTETVEEGARVHGISDDDIAKLVQELKDEVNSSEG